MCVYIYGSFPFVLCHDLCSGLTGETRSQLLFLLLVRLDFKQASSLWIPKVEDPLNPL